MRVMFNLRMALGLAALVLAVSLAGCKDSGQSAQSPGAVAPEFEMVVLSQVVITDYVVVSTRRVGRTVTEYTLRAIATNDSSTRFTNVTATLISVPAHITVVDGIAVFGTVNANGNTTSADDFVIAVDLSVKSSIDELIWRVEGTVPGTGGGGGGGAPDQTGIFMSIDGNAEIRGEAKSKSHPDWIELLSFSEGSSISGGGLAGGSRTTGKVNLEGVTVSKLLDISSPGLRLALAEGDTFTEVKIDIIRSCGGTFYTEYAITLTVSSLTSISMGSSAGDARPSETLTFDYSRIETMYTPVGPGCRLEAPIFSFQDAVGI